MKFLIPRRVFLLKVGRNHSFESAIRTLYRVRLWVIGGSVGVMHTALRQKVFYQFVLKLGTIIL